MDSLVIKNPTREQFKRILEEGMLGIIHGLQVGSDIYLWAQGFTTHERVAQLLGIDLDLTKTIDIISTGDGSWAITPTSLRDRVAPMIVSDQPALVLNLPVARSWDVG